MPLSGDQRALLQLLMVRRKSPEEISDLLDIERPELDSRIGNALEALAPGGEEIPREVGLLLVGQADPMTRADAAGMLDADPGLAARADQARDALAREFPETGNGAPVETPVRASGNSGPPRGATRPGADERSGSPESGDAETTGTVDASRPGLDHRQRRLLSILVSAVGLIAIVVAVVVLLGGDEEEPDLETGPTEARLAPVEGGSGSGRIEFGFAGSEFAANVSVRGVDRSGKGTSYALWLDGPVGAFPFDRAKAGPQGVIAGQSSINQAIICFIAADLFTDVKLSRAPDGKFRKALEDAVSVRGGEGPFPDFVGKTILEGPISMPEETRRTLVRECGGRVPAGDNQGS